MIIVRLMGGHSNQLFQYAIGRSLATKLNTELVLDLSWFKDFADVDTPRVFELDCYPLKARTLKSVDRLKIIDPQQDISRTDSLKRKLGVGSNIWMYYEDGHGFDSNALNQPDNTLLIGYWQSEKYFANLRREILKELEPTNSPLKKNSELISKMKSSESVWIHVRRGDYVTNKHANSFHGVKDAQYYEEALHYLVTKLPKNKAKNINIFICSNDMPWCKKTLKFPYPVYYVENELGSDDMRTVKHCKHDILANSTFSWWGAWLNENPEKIVIAPNNWFLDEKANKENDIVPESWIRL